MGALRRLVFADGVFGGDLGPRLCLEQFVAAAPQLASASVSLNTSFLYVGQAIGSAIGGVLYAHDLLYGIGYAGAAFVGLALITVIGTRNLAVKSSSG